MYSSACGVAFDTQSVHTESIILLNAVLSLTPTSVVRTRSSCKIANVHPNLQLYALVKGETGPSLIVRIQLAIALRVGLGGFGSGFISFDALDCEPPLHHDY